MKIFIDDKGRYKQNSGYGNLSRNLGESLLIAGCEVIYQKQRVKWSPSISSKYIEKFENIFKYGIPSDADVALTICPPTERVINEIPNYLYTQNGLDGLISEWGKACRKYDGVIVPGEFDRKNFSRWNERVFLCPQVISNNIFSSRPKWRAEGSSEFSFIFIGSLSYRKGVDLLLEAFCKFSIYDRNRSRLKMFCPGAKNINFVLSTIRNCNPLANIEIYVEDFSQEWISRHINRSDAFVSFSRGEGWCMPLFESILCEKPCVIPESTAMGECSPNDSIIKIPTRRVNVSSVNSVFGDGFKSRYGESGIKSYDIDIDDGVSALLKMKSCYEKYLRFTPSSRKFVLEKYSHKNVGESLKYILAG